MIGGFQVGPFQPLPAFQQGGAPVPTVVIDTHDGERKRKRDDDIREAKVRRREQLEVAFGIRPSKAKAPLPDLLPAVSVEVLPQQFDFDADDEEIILLI